MGTGAFAARMGQDKNKNSASGLARFLVLFCQSQTTGIIRAHPSHPWFTDKVQRDPEPEFEAIADSHPFAACLTLQSHGR
jgi:hypothetical protein